MALTWWLVERTLRSFCLICTIKRVLLLGLVSNNRRFLYMNRWWWKFCFQWLLSWLRWWNDSLTLIRMMNFLLLLLLIMLNWWLFDTSIYYWWRDILICHFTGWGWWHSFFSRLTYLLMVLWWVKWRLLLSLSSIIHRLVY